jgi:hypothetical protein
MESYWSVNVQNGLAWPIWTPVAQVMAKKRPGVKLAIWLLTTESRESTRFPCMQVACDTSLESSRRGLQLWFRHCHDRRSAPEVIVPQSCGTPILGDFGTPSWESQDKKSFECHSRRVVQSILYGGRWWLPPSPGHGESYESRVARWRTPKSRGEPTSGGSPKCSCGKLGLRRRSRLPALERGKRAC